MAAIIMHVTTCIVAATAVLIALITAAEATARRALTRHDAASRTGVTAFHRRHKVLPAELELQLHDAAGTYSNGGCKSYSHSSHCIGLLLA
jgi:hypothetical protein